MKSNPDNSFDPRLRSGQGLPGDHSVAAGGQEIDIDLTTSLQGGRPQPNAETMSPGSEISSYRIRRLLGEGGMGLVYEAEQRSPRRLVALKVMRQGHQVDETHARLFQHEVETLGRLRHANIAMIYESGHTADGRDFFAMELVDGPTLDAWLNRFEGPPSKAEIRFRLRLFQSISRAVHYAHQRSVIHRDLKPKNIMIVQDRELGDLPGPEGLPTAKILDFGLAQITDADLQGPAEDREAGHIRGTLAYMSPEQARGDADAIDVRTDVYALGVILYEMLTGRRPYALSTTSLVTALREVCETQPEPLQVGDEGVPRIDRELESIVLKALAKDPDDRYGSVDALADDVDRYLGSVPVSSMPSTRAYRVRKFVHRNRALVAVSLALVVALLAGIAGTTLGLVRVRKAEAAARQKAATAERVSSFLANMLASVDAQRIGEVLMAQLEHRVATAAEPGEGGSGPAVTAFRSAVREVSATDAGRILLDEAVLARAGEAIHERFADDPAVAGRLEQTLAQTYERLGMYDRALPHAERAVAAGSAVEGVRSPEVLRAQWVLGTLRYRLGDFAGAQELLDATWKAQRDLLGEAHPDTLSTSLSQAWVMIEQGRLDEAETLLEATLAIEREVLGPTHQQTIDTMNSLAVVYADQRRFGESEEMHAELLELRSRTLGPEHPDTLKSMTNLAVVSFHQGRLEDAADLFADVLAVQRRIFGPTHPTTLASANNLAVIFQQLGRLDEAGELLVWVLEEKRRALGPEHPETLSSLYNLAIVRTEEGRYDEAEQAHAAVFEARRGLLGPSHPQTLSSQAALAGVAARRGLRTLALGRIEAAVDAGYADADSLMSDADFASLRQDPGFLRLVERARENSG